MKYIEQASYSECGLCCLAMICSSFDMNVSITSLRQQWDVGKNGLSFMDIKRLSKKLKLEAKGFKTKDLSKIPTPFILFINNNHFVCIDKVSTSKKKITVYDPAHGVYKQDISELKEPFLILKIYPSKELQNKIPKFDNIKNLFHEYYITISGNIGFITILAILSIVVQLLTVSIPIFLKSVINVYINSKKINIYNVSIMSLLIISIYGVAFLLRSRLAVKLQVIFNDKLTENFVKKLFSLPYKFFSIMDSSDLTHRYSGSAVVRSLFSEKLINIWLDFGTVIFSLIYIFFQNIFIGEFILGMGILQVMISLFAVKQKQYLVGREILEQSNSLSDFMDSLTLMPYIKFKNLEKTSFNRWYSAQKKYSDSMTHEGDFTTIFSTLNSTINFLTPFIATILALTLPIVGNLNIGNIFAIFLLSSSVIAPLSQVINSFDDILYANKYFERMIEIQYNKSENVTTGLDLSENSSLDIQTENVNFKYSFNDRQNILTNINVKIPEKSFVGITGKTGSGKSTLGLVLMGQLPISSGIITVGKINLKQIKKSSFRKKCSIVTQTPLFSDDSIINNITMGRHRDIDRVQFVCKIACVWEDIQLLPMGLETILSKDNDVLSGGQLQRISIARALYDNPKIVLLDEATSALDANTESQVMQNISKLNCTRIMITHRLNTIKNADNIIFLENGHIRNQGTQKYLLSHDGKYKKLYSQFLNSNQN